ncbi:hypothetical protein F511_15772 [Dorcoceras hygrometricum]|nr:hypothetical protein F511_15772 [Dorcoceras hygrometricum]
MASSLISSIHHIDFDSVFSMEDASLAPVFESLIATGLKEFLGCPAIFYEAALIEFFANGSVRNGVVVSTIGGTTVEMSESVFATTFELPSEGLTDLSDVPKDLVFDARRLFSDSKEQVSISCLKKELKIEYRLLHDILLAKTIYVKAGSYDVTRDRFMLMTAIMFDVKINWSTLLFGVFKAMVTPGSKQAKGFAIQIGVVLSNLPGLELGKPRAFPPPIVLNEKTVHRFVHINEQVGMEKTIVSPPMKKTPKNRAVSKKRLVDSDAEVAPIVKKKRTTKSKPAAAIRLPVEEPVSTTSEQQVKEVATGEREPVAEVRTGDADAAIEQVLAQLDLVFKDSDVDRGDRDETWFDRALDEELANANQESEQQVKEVATGEREPVAEVRTGDADAAIEQVLAQLDLVFKDSDVDRGDRDETWFDRALDEELANANQEIQDSEDGTEFNADIQELPVFVETRTVLEAGEKAISSKKSDEEHMSIDDILMQISEDMMLPSVTAAEITKIRLGESISIPGVQERDLFYASLPRISVHDKGKENTDRIMEDVVQFFHSFSLNKLTDFDGLKALKRAETDSLEMAWDSVDIQSLQEFESTSSDGSTVYRSPSPILQKDDSFDQEELLYIVESPESSTSIPQQQESTSSSSDSQMHFDSNDLLKDDTTEAQTSLPDATVDLSSLLDALQASLFQRMDDAHSEILSPLHTAERGLQTTLGNQNEYLRNLIQSARQEGQLQDDLQILRLNELKKSVMAQGVKADTDSLAIRSKFNALDAKILLLDGQVAAIRNEQLEFQAKIAANLLSLSTQIGDIVDYIRGGDAKKGEGSSSRRPLPTPVRVERRPLPTPQPPPDVHGSGQSLSVEQATEFFREADRRESDRLERERARERRERSLSRSGSYKRGRRQ